ncbi:hypothetical protein [aff. Roholtiella sp. LEGE 12411]|uniref:hypothetical protein n=1 Tax=aff. Roholtiella sp. LEGE 12411 TaxID=1828822 RepID=UPI00187E85D4|nr:hypothetical protein [aff. Roholtiella sp. LEGE 12411]MBE9038250.1 hypothetical protein [aff. Roholtiella sp. LEGE 12411]
MPDSARYKETGLEVYIIDLCHQIIIDSSSAERIRRTEYICLNCNVAMKPVAILPENISVPYFRTKKNHQHDPVCSIYTYEKYISTRRKNPVSTLSEFTCGYPNQLCLTSFKAVINQDQSQAIERSKTIQIQIKPRQENNKIRSWQVKTISPLVKQFINLTHPIDRALPLCVPGVSVSTYGEIFQKLTYKQGYRYDPTRIYFVRLQYKSKIDFNNSKIRIPLFEGNWQQGELIDQYFLEIDTNGWPDSHKNVLERQINACLLELSEKRRENNVQPWIFFLGQQATDSSCVFNLLHNDHKLFCCIVDSALGTEKNSTIATPHQIDKESLTVEEPIQKTSSRPKLRKDEESVNKPSIPLKPKNQDNQTPFNKKDSFDLKPEVIPRPSFKKDESLQKSLEKSQYAYDSQSLPSPNEGNNIPSFQEQISFKEVGIDDRQNQPTFEETPVNNDISEQSQNKKGFKKQQTNGLKSIINIRLQQFKNWLRQILQWLRS